MPHINVTKTQVQQVDKDKYFNIFKETELVNTDIYKYLGIIFIYNGKFRVARQELQLRRKTSSGGYRGGGPPFRVPKTKKRPYFGRNMV